MAIAITVLKIIGITILCVLALALILIAIVLFVPIRYRIDTSMEKDEEPYARAGVSFLLHILSVSFVYDKEAAYSVRIFGIKIRPKKNKDNGKDKEDIKDSLPDTASAENKTNIVANDTSEQVTDDIPQSNDYTIDWNEDPFAEEKAGEDEEGKIEAFINRIVSRYEALSDKFDRIRKNIRFWDKMINDTRNREAFELIKTKVIRLLKKIAPRKISGFIHFGFDDPATLGKILVFLSIIYPVLPRKLRFEPDFESTDIYGNVKIKGHFSLITPACILARIYFDKDCRRMWSLYKKHKERS